MPTGTLKITTTEAYEAIPVSGVSYAVKNKQGAVLYNGLTNENGESAVMKLDTLPAVLSLAPNPNIRPYTVYDVWVSKPGFVTLNYLDVYILDGQQAIVPVNMEPLTEGMEEERTIVTPPPLAALPTPPQLQTAPADMPDTAQGAPEAAVLSHRADTVVCSLCGRPFSAHEVQSAPVTTQVLPSVIIPDYITVHLGTPGNTSAANVRVRFIDYVKNVTSHEIYATWPVNSIIANVHCIVTFAVNRVYTEWYRARGFNYDITNSTTVDQYYRHGGQIFQNISQIVDGIFNVYARRIGFRNPYFTEYCNGTTATCKGLSQWGTVTLANRGLTPLQILHNYYPRDLALVTGPTGTVTESYPGSSLTLGSSGAAVRRKQLQLNRIRANFPLIPAINNPNGYFGADTQNAVRIFQRSFNLVQDGIIGRSTWNKISQVFTAVTKLAELGGEGERIGLSPTPPTVVIRQGSRGADVIHAQFLLDYIAQFYPDIPAPLMDSVFGASTTNAVVAFQRRFGLTADGVVGPNTWNRLYEVFRTVQGQVPPAPTPTPVPPAPIAPPYPGLLRQGARGESVRTLQQMLNKARIRYPSVPLLTTDGIFGPNTANAVRAFQRAAGLTVDGLVGPITWAALSAIWVS
ncbi:MAG: peptidoglycan-binding protein [Firmicutes bacterium]|nr:peptidoglycan-binding protein [Bacillota bacterium]